MAELIESGLTLTLIGMSVVFALLTLLVGAIHAMSRLCARLAAAAPAEQPPARSASPAASEPPDAELVGVVTAALTMFRRDRAPNAG